MDIIARTSGDCTILELSGRLIVGQDAKDLRNAVREAAKINPQKIILNLANVTYVDSCGIGELVGNYSHVRSLGGNLVLMDPPERVRRLLAIAQLTPIFEIVDGKQAAGVDSMEHVLLRRMCG
jgi:anti-anti-sigma factor